MLVPNEIWRDGQLIYTEYIEVPDPEETLEQKLDRALAALAAIAEAASLQEVCDAAREALEASS